MVDLSVYNPDFVDAETKQHEERLAVRDVLWREREELRALLRKEVPMMGRFHHALEDRGDIVSAVQTKCLPALQAQGYVKNESKFVSADLLKRGGRVWSLRWIAHGVLGVDRSGAVPKAAEQWNEVVLQVGVDQEKRRIDTEFFGLNEALGENEASFDDREKFHIVWDDGGNRLFYVGLGTNEPYDLEHEDRGVAGASGRPRFYIYDADRGTSLHYDVTWLDDGEFDWDWSVRSVLTAGLERQVSFVEFTDGTRFCVSDPELANAASDSTWEKAQAIAEKAYGPLSPANVKLLRSQFRRFRATVKGPVQEGLPREPPTLRDLVGRAGCDYVAYFTAATVAGATIRSPDELIKGARRLETSRRDEYESLLKRACKEVFAGDVAANLPETMGELFGLDRSGLPQRAQVAVDQWTTKIADEVRRDLYYYGQAPLERMNRLRLGAYLALSEAHGGLYWRVLEQAKRLLNGEEPYGHYAVDLEPA